MVDAESVIGRWSHAMDAGGTFRGTCSTPSNGTCVEIDDRFTLGFMAPLLVLRWAPRLVIDRSDVLLAGAAIAAFGGNDLPLLVDLSRPREVSWDARTAVLEWHHPSRVALLGSDAADLVLTAFTVRSSSEMRFFTDRDEAEIWLHQG